MKVFFVAIVVLVGVVVDVVVVVVVVVAVVGHLDFFPLEMCHVLQKSASLEKKVDWRSELRVAPKS